MSELDTIRLCLYVLSFFSLDLEILKIIPAVGHNDVIDYLVQPSVISSCLFELLYSATVKYNNTLLLTINLVS